jgi:hypothetical protein
VVKSTGLLCLDSLRWPLLNSTSMATEKGLFKDDVDRFTDAHLEICAWFLGNAEWFVRSFFFDRPATEIKVTLEHLITNNRFIIGYADVLLEYETDAGSKQCVLIEAKSQLSDLAACLRQLRAYKEYLPSITKMCVVHSDERYEPYEDDDCRMRRYFSSQGVYVIDFHTPFQNLYHWILPSGRRIVEIEHAEPHGYSFDVSLGGMGFDGNGKDAKTQVYVSRDLDFIRPFGKLVGVDVSPWYWNWSLAPFRQMIGMKLLLDVEHSPSDWGFTDEIYTAIHWPDLSRSLSLD